MKAILAVDQMGGMGYGSDLPWKFGQHKNDAVWFQNHTRGKTVVMGSGTYTSLVNSENWPLKGRRNVVISSKVRNVDDLPQTDQLAFYQLEREHNVGHADDWWLIGGKKLIQSAIKAKMISALYLSILPNFHTADLLWDPHDINLELWDNGFLLKSDFKTEDTGERFRVYKRQ